MDYQVFEINSKGERLKLRSCKKFKKGFTLAEVLITLGIIGVVASISIPILQKNIEDAQYKTAYKKAFSDLSNALAQANEDYSLIYAQTSTPRPSNFDKNFLTIMSKFKTTKQCTNNNNSLCWDSTGEKYGLGYSSGYPDASGYAFIDASGRAWSQYYSGSPSLFVDTNGFKKPNQWGKDRFALSIIDKNGALIGIPIKVKPTNDNIVNACTSNKCETEKNYFGTSWLYK